SRSRPHSRAELWRIEDRLGENVMAGTASQSFNYERDILAEARQNHISAALIWLKWSAGKVSHLGGKRVEDAGAASERVSVGKVGSYLRYSLVQSPAVAASPARIGFEHDVAADLEQILVRIDAFP
ncbi:MAG: hypothetical protein ACREQV_25080, partial [Candidatus Binatia bacterium]